MDYRCPMCRIELGRRKAGRFIVARMEIDCPGCGNRITLNLHPAEKRLVTACFAAFLTIGFLGYWSQNQSLLLLALGVGAAGVLATPFLERTYLREWPRYAPVARQPLGGDPRE